MKMINAQNKNFFFSIQEYSLITDEGYCQHVSGKDPYTCNRNDVSSQSLCENHCTSWTSCIGYFYNIRESSWCYLIPSERSCPSDFSPKDTSGPIAASMNKLKAGYPALPLRYVCYGKA